MRVLLVQSYYGRHGADGVIFPIGLCYIASALKEHQVEILDLNTSDEPFRMLTGKLRSYNPEVVGISLRNIDTTQKRDPFYYFQSLAPTVRLVKVESSFSKVIIGGSGFSMFAEKIMKRIPEIDLGVYLEGEESFPELLLSLDKPENVKGIFFRRNGAVQFTGLRPLPDVETLVTPYRHGVDIRKYEDPVYTNIGIQTKRGCSLTCTYCSYPFLNGRHMRTRSAKMVVDEIESLYKEFGVRRFMFVDSVFNLPEKHAEDICFEIIERGLKVEWSAFFHLKQFSEDLMKLAIKAGCRNFSFSPDAVTNASLRALRKGITEEDISKTVRMFLKAKGVRIEFHIFCTPPGQTFFGFLKTLLFILKVNLLFRGKAVIQLGWIRIEPETKIYETAKSEGVISEKIDLLPLKQDELKQLFYSCPNTSYYADPFFEVFLKIEDRLRPFAKRLLKRS